MNVGIKVVALNNDMVSTFDRADVFEVWVTFCLCLSAGRFNAGFADDGVVAHDMPLCFVSDM